MSNKTKTIFLCTECGDDFAKWSGQCASCKAWGTLQEMSISNNKKHSSTKNLKPKPSIAFNDLLKTGEIKRLTSGIDALDTVLGGGFMPASIILFGGEPGIGKSTLSLQIAVNIESCLYISAEESETQVANRASRLGISSNFLSISSENRWEAIEKNIQINKPSLLIIDSIQTIYSDSIDSIPGSLSQVKECGNRILEFCKSANITVILIGHITKDGKIAGPKMLEHMVDTVINLSGDAKNDLRTLRSTKNRFGATHESAIFEMNEKGLIHVENPSEIFLSERAISASGSIVIPIMEGTRPILIEVQGLVSTATYGNPQRNATGFDMRRLSMLIAILDKRLGYQMSTKDVFVNIVGGLKSDEPSLDLAIISAIASSNQDVPVNSTTVVCGEVGLSGEVRSISHLNRRIIESEKLGFKKMICPIQNLKKLNYKSSLELIGVSTVYEALNKIL
tara:strand:+ start:115 stop:1467 length:1353 start_codon:yes stop_codon:yes gene_type:complete